MLINKTGFGWIEVDGIRYNHDIIIYSDGKIENRYKDFQGDNHSLAIWEAEKVIKGNPKVLVVGTGQNGILSIPKETKDFLSKRKIELKYSETPKAIESFNKITDEKCALFHITC